MKAIFGFLVGAMLFVAISALCAGCVAISARSRVISQEQKYRSKWSDVQSQYQRRMDLLDNLASAVKGYVKEESEVWKQFAAARNNAQKAAEETGVASNPAKQLGFLKTQDALSIKLNAVREAYPELKSDRLFLQYMDEIAGTENRINVARERYSHAIQEYNTTVGLWAQFFGYEPAEYYQSDAEASKAPKITF